MLYSPFRNRQLPQRSAAQAAQAAPGRLYDEQGNKTGRRIDGRVRAATLMGGGDGGSLAGRGQFWAAASQGRPTRDDNIAAARADGTFDAKRGAFNAANKGSYMDEMGRIGPKAPAAPGTTAPATPAPAAPMPVSGQTPAKPTTPPKTGMAAAARGKFTSMPPGSRDLYAEEKAREAKAQETPADAAMNKQADALTKAAQIANSPETAATMAKAKSILEKKPTSMTAAAKPSATPAPKKTTAPSAPPQPVAAKGMVAAAKPGNTSPPAATKPGFFQKRIENNPGGIFSKVKSAGQAVGQALDSAKQSVVDAGNAVRGQVMQQAEKMAAKNPGGIASRLLAPKKPKGMAAAASR